MEFHALVSEHWQEWLWPPLVEALAAAGSAALRHHCHLQVSELFSDGVAWQATKDLADLSLRAAQAQDVMNSGNSLDYGNYPEKGYMVGGEPSRGTPWWLPSIGIGRHPCFQ